MTARRLGAPTWVSVIEVLLAFIKEPKLMSVMPAHETV